MIYNTWDYWVFGLCPSSGILKNTNDPKLRKPDCSRPQVRRVGFWEYNAEGHLDLGDMN
jgi:hypothetical protein